MIIQRGEQTVYLNHELIESVVRHENTRGKVSYVVTMASGKETTEVDVQFERFVVASRSVHHTGWPPAQADYGHDQGDISGRVE